MSHEPDGPTYADAGVDLEAADAAVEAIKPHVARTARPEVLESLSGFGGFFALDRKRWKKPLLVTATDGVGTKLELARELGRHDTVGRDLVAMVVDDLVCSGAEPLLFLDYLAMGRIEPAHVAEIVSGIADGCEEAGCALVGGETAAHPGVLPEGAYDLAGFGLGIVERDEALDADRVTEGDGIVAMASNGLHSNGYSLARRIVADAGLDLSDDHGLRVQSLGEALLRPTRMYAPACLALVAGTATRALCHITGGGIIGNLPRVLPEGLGAVVDVGTFTIPGVFDVLQRAGNVAEEEMWRVFNMGAGMLAIVEDPASAVGVLRKQGVDAWTCGQVVAGGGVRLQGQAQRG